jgi:hypothetical protein
MRLRALDRFSLRTCKALMALFRRFCTAPKSPRELVTVSSAVSRAAMAAASAAD